MCAISVSEISERVTESMAQELTSYAMQYGLDLGTLMQLAYGSTEEGYMDDIREMAAESVQRVIILKAIGDAEGLVMSDDEFQAELESAVSSASGYTSVADVPREDVEAYREVLDRHREDKSTSRTQQVTRVVPGRL